MANGKEGAASGRALRLALIASSPPLSFTPRTKTEERLYLGPWGSRPRDEKQRTATVPTGEAEEALLDWAELSYWRRQTQRSSRPAKTIEPCARTQLSWSPPTWDFTRPEHERRELPSAEHVERLAHELGLEVVDE